MKGEKMGKVKKSKKISCLAAAVMMALMLAACNGKAVGETSYREDLSAYVPETVECAEGTVTETVETAEVTEVSETAAVEPVMETAPVEGDVFFTDEVEIKGEDVTEVYPECEPECAEWYAEEYVEEYVGEYAEPECTYSDPSEGWTYYGTCYVTHYCNCELCCGKWAGGNTASGTYPTAGRTAAMMSMPFGTEVLINGQVYVVEDRGYWDEMWVDVYVDSHEEAYARGAYYAEIYIR